MCYALTHLFGEFKAHRLYSAFVNSCGKCNVYKSFKVNSTFKFSSLVVCGVVLSIGLIIEFTIQNFRRFIFRNFFVKKISDVLRLGHVANS